MSQIYRMRKVSLLFLLLGITIIVQSQTTTLGVFGGVSNYLGDLTEKLYQNSRAAVGINLDRQITRRISLRAGLTFGKVAAADSTNPREDFRLRNFSFQSTISELSLVAEVNTLDMSYKRWSPYLFGGFAVFHFNPYTFNQQGLQIYLQPLSTEGQGLPGYSQKPYARTQWAIPFGGGIKYNISDNVRIALEIGLRKLFTDYLDDVSGNYADPNDLLTANGQQSVDLSYRGDEVPGGNPVYPSKADTRGSPKYKDYYYFSGVHLSFLLPDAKSRERSFAATGRNKQYGCPTVF
jgi:hypothetical protein